MVSRPIYNDIHKIKKKFIGAHAVPKQAALMNGS